MCHCNCVAYMFVITITVFACVTRNSCKVHPAKYLEMSHFFLRKFLSPSHFLSLSLSPNASLPSQNAQHHQWLFLWNVSSFCVGKNDGHITRKQAIEWKSLASWLQKSPLIPYCMSDFQSPRPWEKKYPSGTCSNHWKFGFLGRLQEKFTAQARRLVWSSYADPAHSIPLWRASSSITLDKAIGFWIFYTWWKTMDPVFHEASRMEEDYLEEFGRKPLRTVEDYEEMYRYFYKNWGRGIQNFPYKWVIVWTVTLHNIVTVRRERLNTTTSSRPMDFIAFTAFTTYWRSLDNTHNFSWNLKWQSSLVWSLKL